MSISTSRSALLVTCALVVGAPSIANAQQAVPIAKAEAVSKGSGDIIVTARRRDETSIAVPVVLTAVTGAELQQRGINNLDSIAQLVPSLTLLDSGGSRQGGTIAMRGVAGPDTNPLGDQAVSFNIDGVQVAKSSVRRLAVMDLQQVEVLKGPQALFFGKNSPGGIISMRTADPTSNFQAKGSVGYEINAREWRGDGFISSPLTDTLGARLAFYGSDMRGWVKKIVPADSILPPIDRYGPRSREFGLRGTLKFDPTDAFSARLKVAYGKVKGAATNDNGQMVNCPFGTTQLVGVISDCKADNRIARTDNIGTLFTPYEPHFRDGQTYAIQEQTLAGLELNHKLRDTIDLTSVTGFYRSTFKDVEVYGAYPVVPLLQFGVAFGLPDVAVYAELKNREISQEVRVNSHFDGPLNFTVGGIYSDTRSSIFTHTILNYSGPTELLHTYTEQHGIAYSAFGQARFDLTPQLELSAGGRYSHEKKTLAVTLADFTRGLNTPMSPYTPAVDNISFNDFSPELTATYRPTDRLTVFGSYKRGFLSGGFNGSVGNSTLPLNYGPQKIRGFEGGVKALLFDGALRVNLSAYTYKVPGLQITAFDPFTGINTIRNAGGARTKGIDFDMNYRSPIEGLTLRGAISYNSARYISYFGPCWLGQSQAQGCNYRATGNGNARPILPGENGNNQNLAGRQVINAPEWSGNMSASYETPLGSALKLGLSGGVTFASSVPTDATLNRDAYSPKHALLDATLRIADAKDAWELALIGQNLNNKFYWTNTQPQQFTGGAFGTAAGGARPDIYAVPNRGRQIMVRLTVAFGQ
ncbi:TonB-dependent receptor [Rhizorhapis suberifaciens]|uniref:Iron complex outermembrane receptor protein n=1 Tax=Rhizorhapis suberifaciens TaxID=13656 RepID=A0A840HT89_9SPHN|nr:TonB-dependent receptor [Rhizorhapis suberifaciens]MBB4640827.1 iron complex outermembrane receptor protein [Rhizorhapis suberifaciens]